MSVEAVNGRQASVADGVPFACPMCRGALRGSAKGYHCPHCALDYPLLDDVFRFFVDPAAGPGAAMRDYTETFLKADTARVYARSFEDVARKRWRTRRELMVLEKILDGDPGASVLNIPCGSGRLSAPLCRPGGLLFEADSSPGQLALHRRLLGDKPGLIRMTASAFFLPFRDGAVDTVVCARLSHHLVISADRERLLAELLRVARRRLVFSFRNRASLPSVSRRLRRRDVHSNAMSVDEVRILALRHGGRVARLHSVSNLGARHSYALIVKTR